MLAAFTVQACSVAPPPDPTTPGRETERTVLRRVSAVIVTEDRNLHRWVNRGFPVRQAPGDADGGSATPVTEDGYFLTADHVLANMNGRHVYVIYGGGGPLKPHRARVVWRSENADLALLHIDSPTPLFYRFTTPHRWLPAGTPVRHGGIATGFNSEPGLLGTSLRPEGPFTGTRKFKIDIPLQPGDSGGPVVDARGDLVGINSAVEFLVPMETAFFVDSEASRPSIRAIESLIEKDRAARTTAAAPVE
ncbi:MAG TPA: serine protease [Luteolibacter sp.]|nr:serine protease [Luteolibacter sp.]